MIIEGFHWHVTEDAIRALLVRLHSGGVTTVRLYDDPNSGASRGIAFVELAGSSQQQQQHPAGGGGGGGAGASVVRALQDCASRICQEHVFLRTTLCFLTNGNWDRGGRLPDLPWESQQQQSQIVLRLAEGFGSQGFLERAVCACCPNTATDDGKARLSEWRKRMRSNDDDLQIGEVTAS